ncbi:hypothetical protein [Planotetraspora kaengkrachanensis]|uniref:Uncharacterized protein n=1 Tax=Planotetraspora kaengkrachanensis TaxID=575193 RepID=A0A8J3PVK7_9ACTN|nr:hypothetical protein [Planotetraspora kaengkrachanensis]GIG81901.1 hypothetical protein Pka01_50280 [Planotetraspora kaengkrachanensis]
MRHGLRRHNRLVARFVESAVVPVARPGPFTVLWRWRYEAALLIGVPALVAVLWRAIGMAPTIAGTAVICLVAVVLPQARREVEARFWCVVTPHRVRRACAEALIVTRKGKLPIIVHTKPEPFGERLWIWCRAGTSPGDLERARDLIAASCWLASDVRVMRHPDRASLAIVDVVRRAEHGEREWTSAPTVWARRAMRK